MRALPALMTSLLLLPAGVVAQDLRAVSGSVSYLDRMALPDGAVVLLQVTGSDGRMLSETRLPTTGQQVPVPFSIAVGTADDVSVRAGITIGAELVWLGDPQPAGDGPVELVLDRYQPLGFNATYRCGAQILQTGYAGDALVMDTGTARLVLQPVATASGARYDGLDDPGTYFWNRGDSAMVSIADVELPQCRLTLPPVDAPYLARGNEPFWSVAIDAGSMTIGRLGLDDLVLPVTGAGLQADGAIFVTGGDRARLLRDNSICSDSMSGMPYPETVTLTLGDDVLTGCGGDSRDLLTGQTWVVRQIADDVLPDDIRITLGFDPSGNVAGAAGCNRWFAGYDLTGEGLSLTQPGATMMACDAAIMTQERAFLDALATISGFAIDESGALVMTAQEQPLITAIPATDGSAP